MEALALQPVASDATSGPRTRTLLVTDLCDSTEVVAKLGDIGAARVFREHDSLVLRLQQRWHGRQVDRSDGLLMLFVRAIDGLGFALDYNKGLAELGNAHGVTLKARAGLHVGEVLAWLNSADAVELGAKSMEVEGLAKPMAARLMSLARPGQILLSAVAEPLAHRAASELGERADKLVWKSHGRWNFKGVPGSQEVHEVGEVGSAPLRMPRNGSKAWRQIPFWRRPASLVAQCIVLAALLAGAWFMLRPQPAIAFGERDWVVVGDLRNLTGDVRLDNALEEAFRISLEQSRHVNLLSDLSMRQSLERMQRPPDTPIDRALASEIALREGARAVIVPSVAEIGGRLRISAEIVDPHSATTVFATHADGAGVDSALDSVDKVVGALRGRLGEALASIQTTSKPLPQVSTANLDALRVYALANQAVAEGDAETAQRLFRQATELDPEFAMAWLGLVRVGSWQGGAAQAEPALRKAQQLRTRLPTREALYLDAVAADIDAPGERLERWMTLARMYPDHLGAQGTTGVFLRSANRLDEAEAYLRRTLVPQYPMQGRAWQELGRLQLARSEFSAAARSFDVALQSGVGSAVMWQARMLAAQRLFDEAAKVTLPTTYQVDETVLQLLDQGHWAQAQAKAETAMAVTTLPPLRWRSLAQSAALAAWAQGDHQHALNLLRRIHDQASNVLQGPCCADAIDNAAQLVQASELAWRIGERDMVATALSVLQRQSLLQDEPRVRQWQVLLQARVLMAAGRDIDAVALLREHVGSGGRYLTHSLLLQATRNTGDHMQALEQARWLQAQRGLAWVETGGFETAQPLNLLDSTVAWLDEAELLSELGRKDDAHAALARFDSAWLGERLPMSLQQRRQRVTKQD